MPDTLAVFPLEGVLLLPMGRLPLNIFEPRYLRMIADALAGNRMIGMIQPRDQGGASPALYDVGCAGKITAFEETPDGRFLITLTGISRFKIRRELDVITPYRQVVPDWTLYRGDLEKPPCLDIDRAALLDLLKNYFRAEDMTCDWDAVQSAPDHRLITCLAMVCPFEAKEKQALVEEPCCKNRAAMFMTMLDMAVRGRNAKGCKGCH